MVRRQQIQFLLKGASEVTQLVGACLACMHKDLDMSRSITKLGMVWAGEMALC